MFFESSINQPRTDRFCLNFVKKEFDHMTSDVLRTHIQGQ